MADRYVNYDKLLEERCRLGLDEMSMIHKVNALNQFIDHLPTADVVEVKHGEWIKKHGIYVCSECDFTCPYDVVGDNMEYWECLYCRNCGAKMDGRSDT